MSETAAPVERLAAPPAWANRLFASRLAPLVVGPDGEVGVWSIAGDKSRSTITDQFTANAGEYHARYSASAHFQNLINQAFLQTGLQPPETPVILDLGSGSGVNSIVPCFNLFPGARQVATDLSAELLTILAAYAVETGVADRVVCVVMDAMSEHVSPGQFDLVTGASILHHLLEPARGMAAAARALKPGGHAIFIEPFDGYGLIRLAYERILAEADLRRRPWRRHPLDPQVDAVLRDMISDIAGRTMPDFNRPGFADMDDKWLFSRERIEILARRSGFSAVSFVPHNDHDSLYRDMAAVQLRLATGLDTLTLPDWALTIMDDFDRALPPPVKRLLMLEGSIVLTKAA
ncbi:MAG: class I SAM-dependent methyltransferase [Phenylobacterium sp.]